MIAYYQRNKSHSTKHTPNMWVEYRDHPDDLHKAEFIIRKGDDVVAEITGATASVVIYAFLEGAHRETLIRLREVIEDKLND